MSLKIRLQRKGTKNAPKYRLVVAESTCPRDGRFVEVLGHYNPCAKGQELEFNANLERIDYWVSVGAKPSETVHNLIKAHRKQATAQAV